MEYFCRRLNDSDVPLLKDLLSVFGAAFNEHEEYQSHVPHDTYLKSLLQKEDFAAIVAQVDQRVLGGLTAYVLPKPEQERKEIFIYDLAVAEEHRRRGIATALIVHLKKIARELGAYVIFVQADKGDEPAIGLYQSLGKGEETWNFDIDVD